LSGRLLVTLLLLLLLLLLADDGTGIVRSDIGRPHRVGESPDNTSSPASAHLSCQQDLVIFFNVKIGRKSITHSSSPSLCATAEFLVSLIQN
jgi:hypothetical protein